MMEDKNIDDLGFEFQVNKKGDLLITHHRKLVTKLTGKNGLKYVEKLNSSSFKEQQLLMAKLTGNYKRGNEKL